MPEQQPRPVYRSGECEIDRARRELGIRGSPVPVGGRAFEIIEVLAQSAGKLVSKDELMDRVWRGAIVGDNTLHVHISALRNALGSHRAMLKTDSGRGYRLLGEWSVRGSAIPPPVVPSQQETSRKEPPASNLPVVPTRLAGRSSALQRVRDLLSAYRVVTLTGPGGIGKTSLALHAARAVSPEFADGGWLVEFASACRPRRSSTGEVMKVAFGS